MFPPLQKPAEHAEKAIIKLILDGHYPAGSFLPSERDLATLVGVTRPTLREALQRLARDGWIHIQQGKPTRVTHYWQEGGLSILRSLSEHENISFFVPHLLQVRTDLAPSYTRLAIERNPESIVEYLQHLPTTTEAFVQFDWGLHHLLCSESGNPLYVLVLNGFKDVYASAGLLYFQSEEAQQLSGMFYQQLAEAASRKDAVLAAHLAKEASVTSHKFWLEFTR